MQKRMRRDELRAQKACEQCARRKVKCDLILSGCSTCLSRGQQCTFSYRRKPGPPKGYKRDQAAKASNVLTPTSSQPVFTNDTPQAWSNEAGQDQWLDKLGSETFDDDFMYLYPEQQDYMNALMSRDSTSPQLPGSTGGPQRQEVSIDLDLLLYGPGFDIQNQLVVGYLSWSQQLFPLFPMFKKSTLDNLLRKDRESVILDAVCAVSARISKAQDCTRQSFADAGEFFAARAKSRSVTATATPFHKPNLEDIKGSLLLAIDEILCRPKAQARMDETVRLALDFGLDKIDSGDEASLSVLSKEEREDGRCLWWSIYELDGFSSWKASRAGSVDPRKATTLLPSVPYPDLADLDHISENPKKFPLDISQMWKEVVGCRSLSNSSQHIYLVTVAFSRQLVKRLCTLRSGNNNPQLELLTLEDCMASYRLALPKQLQENSLPPFPSDTSPHTLRFNAETLLIMHMTTISLCMSKCVSRGESPSSSSEPWDAKDWHKCLAAAFSVVDVIRDIPPNVLLTMSPTICGIFWLAGACIGLQLAISIDVSKKEYFLARFNLACSALNRMAELWGVAREFYDSLQDLERSIHTIETMTDVWYILKNWIEPSTITNYVPENGCGCYFAIPVSWSVVQPSISFYNFDLDGGVSSVSSQWHGSGSEV